MLRKPIDSITQFAGITTLSIGEMYCSPAISRSKPPHVGVYLFGAVYKKEKKGSEGKALAAAVDRSAIARGSTHNSAPYRRRLADRRPAQAALKAARCGADCVRNNAAKNVRLGFFGRPDELPVSGAGVVIKNQQILLLQDNIAAISGNVDFPQFVSYNVPYTTRKGINMNAIIKFDDSTTAIIQQMLVDQHRRLGHLDPVTGEPLAVRSITARNYDSGIKALGQYLTQHGYTLPTKSALSAWRDDMLQSGKSVRTVNARLAAARKLLRAVADDITDIQTKLVLNDWAKVEDAKAIVVQDKTEEDYGRRLTLDSLRDLIKSIDVSHIKGLRDRALIAVMAGAGLRVSEAVNLTIADVLSTVNESGQRGIRIRRGKHNKSRIVVLNSWNSWVIKAIEAYVGALGLSALENPSERVFRGIKREKNGKYSSVGTDLSARAAERAIADYQAEYMGAMVTLSPHDLRRTYAKLCKQSGMSWEALRANMGHSSVTITEKYVGLEVDWSERTPNWTIEI